MVVLLSTAIISCSQLMGLYMRLQENPLLTQQQKDLIMHEVLKVIPSCPLTIDKKPEPKKK